MTTTADEPGHGRYDVLAAIGDGPRGPVFVVRRRGDAAADPWFEVGIHAFATGEDDARRRFTRDIQRALRLRHRNLLAVVELGERSGRPFVVTEHVEDCTLAEIGERHRAIRPPRLVIAAAIDALYGLHAAHALCIDGAAQPLIHGGVTPDHLRLGLDGSCRMAGFGSARPRVQTRASHRTRDAAGYLAPEQLTGGDIDPRCDVFAMGIVLWNALTGKQLFHDRIEHMTMSNVLERKVPRPSAIGLSPPPALDGAVMKALERDPAHRYQTAAEMAGVLRDAARDAGCLAGADELGEWVATSFGHELAARRHRLRELAELPAGGAEVPVLPRLGRRTATDHGARDELSLDELARATGALPLPAAAVALSPIGSAAAPSRKQLAFVALVAFGLVALVLGWQVASPGDDAAIALTARPAAVPDPVELEVTVLDVRSAAPAAAPEPGAAAATASPAAPGASTAAAAAAPAAPAVRAPDTSHGDPAPRSASTAAPVNRAPPARVRKPAPRPEPPPPPPAPARPAETHAEPAAAKPVELHPDPPAPAKPEPPPRPPLESNPYLQK